MGLLNNVQSRRVAADRPSEQGDLIQIGVYLTVLITLVFLVHFGILALQRHRAFNLKHLHLASFLLILCLVVPFLIFLSCAVFGAMIGQMESWTNTIGMQYCLSNALGLSTPLTNKVPITVGGKIVDVFLSTWVYVLCSTTVGLVSLMSFSIALARSGSSTPCGFLRSILIYIPVVLLLIAVPTGGILCLMESWSFDAGYLFMISQILGLANPLVANSPHTVDGIFFELLCTSIELCLSGTVLGIITNNPFMKRIAVGLESFRFHHVVDSFLSSFRSRADKADEDCSEAVSETNAESVDCSPPQKIDHHDGGDTLVHTETFETACETEKPLDSLTVQDWSDLRCRQTKLRRELEQICHMFRMKDGRIENL